MNDARRKALREAMEALSAARSAIESILQQSDRGDAMTAAIDAMESAISSIEDAESQRILNRGMDQRS